MSTAPRKKSKVIEPIIDSTSDLKLDGLDIKRGVHLDDGLRGRLLDGLENSFLWWEEGKFNKFTVLFLLTLFLVNYLLALPVLKLNVTPSYSSSVFLFIANSLENYGVVSRDHLFTILTIMAFNLAPFGFYFFIRKNVLKHDLTAFLATLFFILPIPFLSNGMPLVGAILLGDGAHAFAFSLMPFFLLAIQQYVTTGEKAYGVIASLGSAAIAIISPFAFFNLLIIFTILSVSEAFLGRVRIKISRISFILVSTIFLSFFWYHPLIFTKIILIDHVAFTLKRSLAVLPYAIPTIPVVGTVSFLVFDRREKLRPIFIGITLLVSYYLLYSLSRNLNITGIFTAERYVLELTFAAAFCFAFLVSGLNRYFFKNYIMDTDSKIMLFMYSFVATSFVVMLATITFMGTKLVQSTVITKSIVTNYNSGIGNITRVFSVSDTYTLVSVIISLLTLCVLLGILAKPSSKVYSKS